MKECFEWIVKIIDTSYQPFHLECVLGIIDRFADRYGRNEYHELLLEKWKAKGPMVMVG